MRAAGQKQTQLFSKFFLIIIFAATIVSAFFIVENNNIETIYANQPVMVNYIIDTTTTPGSYYVSGELVSAPGVYEVGTFASSSAVIPAIDADRILSGAGTELDPYVYMSCSILFDSTYDINGVPELDINSGYTGSPIPLTLSNGDYELSGGFTDNFIVISNGANVILNGLTIIDDTYNNSFIKVQGGTLTVNDALLYITNSDNYGYYDETSPIEICGDNSTVNINGGTLKTYMHFNTINILGDQIDFLQNITLNINGGTFLAENKQRELNTNQTEGGIIYSSFANGTINILGGTLNARIKSSLIKIQECDIDLTIENTVLNYENVLPYISNELGSSLQVGGDHGAIIYNGTGEIMLNEGIDFNILLDNFHYISEDFAPASDSLFIRTNVAPTVGTGANFDETIYVDFVFETENEGTQTILTGTVDTATFKPYLTMLNYSFVADTVNNGIKATPNQFNMSNSLDYGTGYYYVIGIFGPWAKENTPNSIVTIPFFYNGFYGTKDVKRIINNAFGLLNNGNYYDSYINTHILAMTVLNLPASLTNIDNEAFKIEGGNLHIVNYAGVEADLELGVFDNIVVKQGEITQTEYEIMAELILQYYIDMGVTVEEIENYRTQLYAYYSDAILGDSSALSEVLNIIGAAVGTFNYPLLLNGETPTDLAIDVDPIVVTDGKIYLNYGVYQPIDGLDIITTSANYSTLTSQGVANTWKSYSENLTYERLITFNTNGGSTVSSINRLYNRAVNYIQNTETTDYAVDENYALPTSVKSGFIFAGWFSDELMTQAVTEESVITTNTLFAGWTSKTLATITNIEDLTKIYDGTAVSDPTFSTLSDGQVTIEYYVKDGALLPQAPTDLGSYTVKIIVAESATYLYAEEEADFTINMASVMVNVGEDTEQDVTAQMENGFVPNTTLVVISMEQSIVDFAGALEQGQEVTNIYNAQLIVDGIPTIFPGENITLTIKLPENLKNATNIKVYVSENNLVVKKVGQIEGDYLTFTVSSLGDFVFSADIVRNNLYWLWILLLLLLLVLLFLIGRKIYIDKRKTVVNLSVTNNVTTTSDSTQSAENEAVKTEEDKTIKAEENKTIKAEEDKTIKAEKNKTIKAEENKTIKTEEDKTIKAEENNIVVPLILSNDKDDEDEEDFVQLDTPNKKRKKREYGMNKKELIEAMVQKADISKKTARKFIDFFQEILVQELKKKNKVVLEGFISFEAVKVPTRFGINPLTQEKIKIKKHIDIKAKMSKVFKGKFNNK